MPTVILLDVSLSMSRPLPDNAEVQIRQLAHSGIKLFLDHLGNKLKLEFVSLIIFSSLWENKVPFTRDYASVQDCLSGLDDYDKTAIPNALVGVSSVVTDEWGNGVPCNVLLITDGGTGLGSTSIQSFLHDDNPDKESPFPFPFPCNLLILALAPPDTRDTFYQSYRDLIIANGNQGQVYLPEGAVSRTSVDKMFEAVVRDHFSPYSSVLQCGHLKSAVQLFPGIKTHKTSLQELDEVLSPASVLEVCGFLNITDVASPPHLSRHLVLAAPPNGGQKSIKKDDEDDDSTKQPALTVLLHGSLKVASKVALVQVGFEWYGMLYSFADSKKKANLLLSVFRPGLDVIPWLGGLDALSPAQGVSGTVGSFPVSGGEAKSYSQNCVVWIKAAGLQADIQKVLRSAKRIPEKQQQFYKDLNRVHKASISLKFPDLLDFVARLLERECTLLPGNAHPDAALQLTHAANALRSPDALDFDTNIEPMKTNF